VENDIATIKEELNVKEKNVPEVMTIGEMLDMHRKDGTISTRLFNCFNRIYAKTKWKSTTYIFDLNGYSKKRLLSDVRNLGIKTLEEMEELLKQHNVFLSE
jgi:proteasome assembly chaperone (PAC2) family protein